jgi:SAM-dependent methyltransferase
MSTAQTTVEPRNPAISFTERTRCALCDSPERTIYRAFRDIPVVRCSRCGFLYSSRIMSEDTMHAYYRDNFGSLRHMQGQVVNARTNGVAVRKLIDLKNVRSWLDVGAGYGFLLKWLKDNWSIRAEGVEISSQEADHARNDLGLKISSNMKDLPRESFDVVSSFEVIEHVAEPKPFVHELAKYVRPGGYLVVMTDNFESVAAHKLQGGFQKWIPHTHISHFGPATLRDCVNSVDGLKLENEASYTPWDVVGRQLVSTFRPPVADEQAYDVRDALSTEMQRNYKLYRLRYLLNPVWAGIDFHRTMEGGALMYAVCRKQS